MDFQDSVQEAEYKLQVKANFRWRDKQLECLKAVFNGNDILAVLPTGYGKSMVFQAAPFMLSARDGVDVDMTDKVILIITPLNSIMMDQCLQLCEKEIQACYLDYNCNSASAYSVFFDDDEERQDNVTDGKMETSVPIEDIKGGKYNIVFCHPESLLCSAGRQLVRSLRQKICAFAVDEAHIVLEWGDDFRKDFTKLGSDVVPLLRNVPKLLFTATAPPNKQDELIQMMNLQNPVKILENPDRPNIQFLVNERAASMNTLDDLDVLLNDIGKELLEKKKEFPITVVYTDTAVISYAYRFLANLMGEQQYVGDDRPENRLFAQYHQQYTEKMKKFIVAEICKEDSTIRLVLATVCLGMGLNAPSIRHVIHFKPPTSLEKYYQEVGRAGRDGQPAKATLFYNNTDVRSNRPGITKEMIRYCKQNTECRRKFMLAYFGHDMVVKHSTCCDVCDHQQG